MFAQRLFLVLLFTFSAFFPGYGQQLKLSPSAKVSVLTCGSGDELYSLFGHTAVRIFDPVSGLDTVYNYGAFDFETPNFVVRFSKGDLQYFVTSGTFSEFLVSYQYEGRSVYEQTINMSAVQKQQLYDRLTATLVSDDRFYTYKFIDRNCTTMVVDLLNDILQSKAIIKKSGTDMTYREVLYPYFDNHFYEQLGTSIIFGAKVDRDATTVFLPIELFESLAITKHNGSPLMLAQKPWLEFAPPAPSGSWWNNPYTYGILLLLVALSRNRRIAAVYFLIAGALGIFFTVAGLYSYHGELAANYNALLFNPAMWLLVYFDISGNRKWLYRTAVFCAATLAVYLVIMVNKVHLVIVLPIVVTQAILLARIIRRNGRLTIEAKAE